MSYRRSKEGRYAFGNRDHICGAGATVADPAGSECGSPGRNDHGGDAPS
jgi:hypothetical protein